MRQAGFDRFGNATVYAGSPALVGVALVEADGATPQALGGRRFAYSVWRPGNRQVVFEASIDGEAAVIEDDRTVLKLGPDGEETGGWELGTNTARLQWAFYELTEAGPVAWIGPAAYEVLGARDAATPFPEPSAPGASAPYAVLTVAGEAGAAVLVVSAMGAPGVAAPVASYATGTSLLEAGAQSVLVSEAVDLAAKVELYIGGARQRPEVDYTADGTSTLQLTWTVDQDNTDVWWLHSHA